MCWALADNSTRRRSLTSPLSPPASRPLSGCDPTFLRLGGGPPRPTFKCPYPACLRELCNGGKGRCDRPCPPRVELREASAACKFFVQCGWCMPGRWPLLMAKAEAADALQRPASACPASPIFGVRHPSRMGILSRLVLTTPPLSPAGAPGIGETRRTLLSPPSSPDPVRLATGILRGAYFETLVFPALSSDITQSGLHLRLMLGSGRRVCSRDALDPTSYDVAN